MTIEERMNRNNLEDQIYIGELIEKFTLGEIGATVKCIINGITAEELYNSRTTQIPAERALGRIESLHLFLERLDNCVDIKNKLLEEKREESKV
jgi:hypothetical protein